MRKLASVQKIKEIHPIEGADNIVMALVQGWEVVIKKNEFNVGDLVIYCEIDSVLPASEQFKFLETSKYRIKTRKLRGQVSQGICFPLSIVDATNLNEGDDVTDLIGVTKYEPPVPTNLGGDAAGLFPSFIFKTDEQRVQNYEKELHKYAGTECSITLKLDGSSSTYYYNNNKFGVASRNIEFKDSSENSFWNVARKESFEQKLRNIWEDYGFNIALQGEIVGPGIQKNRLQLKEHTVYFFNAFNIDRQEYLSNFELEEICNKYNLNMVPIIERAHVMHTDVKKYVNDFNNLKHPMYKGSQSEGVVIRPNKEIWDSFHRRISFKVINNAFLLKGGED